MAAFVCVTSHLPVSRAALPPRAPYLQYTAQGGMKHAHALTGCHLAPAGGSHAQGDAEVLAGSTLSPGIYRMIATATQCKPHRECLLLAMPRGLISRQRQLQRQAAVAKTDGYASAADLHSCREVPCHHTGCSIHSPAGTNTPCLSPACLIPSLTLQ